MKLHAVLAAALASPALAISIDRIDAPPNLLRPVDNATYSFPVLVQATVNAAEAANGGSFDIYYRDTIPFGIATDATIDGLTLRVPAGLFQAGAKLAATVTMRVGCSTITVGGETFGPLTGGIGTTGNAVSLAEFLLPGLGAGGAPLFFGTNRVECIQAGLPASNGTVLEQMPLRSIPSPGSPMPTLPPPRSTVDFVAAVPEPATWLLWAAAGLLGLARAQCTAWRGRR